VGLNDEGGTADLKSKVHQGNSSVLNLVYMPRDQSGQGKATLGTCVVPVPGQNVATDIGSQDGCVVGEDTLPKDNGSDSTGSARGNPGGRNGHGGQSRNFFGRQVGQKRISPVTTTHEMGHWLGLEHVGGRGQSMQIPQEGGSSLFGRLSRALKRQSGGDVGNVMEAVSRYACFISSGMRSRRLIRLVLQGGRRVGI
jgi:hypothetical protein